MVANTAWTDEEKADVLRLGVEGFLAINTNRTYHATRHQLARLRAEGISTVNEPLLPDIGGRLSTETIDISAIRQRSEEMFAAQHETDLKRKYNSVQFDSGPIAIFFVGDQHIGNAGTDVRRMFEEQDTILSTPGAYVVMTGDTVDNFIIGKLISQNMVESLAVRDQWALACEYVKGFGTRIIAKVSGNHDQWATKLMGVDYDRQLTPDGILYDADDITFTVHLGSAHHSVVIRVRHKWRGNSLYNPTHAIERAARFDSARPDVFVGAHVHQGATAREFILDGQRKLALMSSSYKVYDGYQRQEGFASNDASTAVGLVIESDGSFWGSSNLGAIQRYLTAYYIR